MCSLPQSEIPPFPFLWIPWGCLLPHRKPLVTTGLSLFLSLCVEHCHRNRGAWKWPLSLACSSHAIEICLCCHVKFLFDSE